MSYKNYRGEYYASIEELQGKVLSDVKEMNDELYFFTTDGWRYVLRHNQDCCEHVYIESIVGDLQDLIGETLVIAEEVSSDDYPPKGNPESYTWTFYKFATRNGYVDIRWYGTSNGYYSEGVSCYKTEIPNE